MAVLQPAGRPDEPQQPTFDNSQLGRMPVPAGWKPVWYTDSLSWVPGPGEG